MTRHGMLRLQQPWSGLACLAFGMAAAVALHTALKPPAPKFELNLNRVRMVAVSGGTPAAAKPAPAPALPAPNRILPLRGEQTSAKKRVPPPPAPAVVAPAPAAEMPTTPPVAAPAALPTLPTLSQPSFAVGGAAPAAPANLPPLPSAELPPMPGAEPVTATFQLLGVEKPGGDILVLGVLVNDQNIVQDTLIVVPSRFPLSDLGLSLSYRGQQWAGIEPPMQPGETRWLELRIDQANINGLQDSSQLP